MNKFLEKLITFLFFPLYSLIEEDEIRKWNY